MAAAILSDQKSYGFWDLFSVSARASKLLSDGPVGLSPEARAFVERQYLPPLGPAPTELWKLIAKGGDVSLEPLDPVLERLRGVVGVEPSPAEREFYRSYVCDGSRCDQLPAGRQRAFRRLLQSHSALHRNVNRDDFVSIREAAQGQDPELARRIGHVIALGWDQMARVHEALLTGRFRTTLEHLLEWSRLVMMRRSSSPWVRCL